jgi:hypothetical protein
MNTIFTFDHSQEKLNKAIGIEESYLDDLHEQIRNDLKNIMFDEEKKEVREGFSTSKMVELLVNDYSYSQLVIMASFFLKDRMDAAAERFSKQMKDTVKTIALNADDLPEEIKNFLEKLARDMDKDEE